MFCAQRDRTGDGDRNHRRCRQRSSFQKGRELAAWLGIVPGKHTTGGKQKLVGISKRGNSYLRGLFVHEARAVLQQSAKQSSGLSLWLVQLTTRTHQNVALANKLARMDWAPSSPRMNPFGPRSWSVQLQRNWPADDAWLRPGLGNRIRDSHLYRPAAATVLMISARSAGEL